MAAFFVDLDGTLFYYGTNDPLPGAVPRLQKLIDAGHQIIFTTRRPSIGQALLMKFMRENFSDDACRIIFDVDSPRVVINDDGAIAINHPRDAAWTYQFQI